MRADSGISDSIGKKEGFTEIGFIVTPLYTGLMQLHAQSQSVHRFCQTLVQDATAVPKILIAGSDLVATQQLLDLGFPTGAFSVITPNAAHQPAWRALGLTPEIKDIRLWTPATDQWDGVWAPEIFSDSATTQRVLTALFRGIKSRGILWVQWSGPHWNASTAHPLLRQSGFDVIVEATLPNGMQGALARRVG